MEQADRPRGAGFDKKCAIEGLARFGRLQPAVAGVFPSCIGGGPRSYSEVRPPRRPSASTCRVRAHAWARWCHKPLRVAEGTCPGQQLLLGISRRRAGRKPPAVDGWAPLDGRWGWLATRVDLLAPAAGGKGLRTSPRWRGGLGGPAKRTTGDGAIQEWVRRVPAAITPTGILCSSHTSRQAPVPRDT
jgi:hypothetical protein